MNAGISNSRMQELLALARARANANKPAIDSLSQTITENKVDNIDFSKAGIPNEKIATETGQEAAVDFIQEITSSAEIQANQAVPQENKLGSGVTREIELNVQQSAFCSTLLSGADCCFIGPAGTGKTTATGRSIKQLISTGTIAPVGGSTKWLSATHPGICVLSYTRKAVNNIRRAVPEEVKAHTLTLHKILEFAPQFFEIEEPANPGSYKKTVTFIPTRNKANPLPPGLKLAIFEESSMIGTDLYDLWRDASPHMPQEVFIGDIQQLPPIFGPAILGFKMALLPVIELTEVYRQALNSPIIRLAHAILRGDPYKFDKRITVRDEPHEVLKDVKGNSRILARKCVESLEAFNENSEHGLLKFQIWQKNQESEVACNATIQQFIAWIKSGYYNPAEDIILCPFNKSFGTVALNKGIHEYLGKQRGATVHEIIAGYNKHYYAEGDRVLYDKEDAVIISIKRNLDYLGKAPQTASQELNRDGHYVKEISEAEQQRAEIEAQLSADAVDEYLMDQFSDLGDGEGSKEDRVNAASHSIRIRYAFSDEEVELRSSAEINNLLGGHALTVHKFQGSENSTIFFVLHKSHATMIQRELLYTAVTRARSKLHIICEADSFFNGVKSQKVKGNTLEEKLKYFMGKTKFEEMEEEFKMLRMMKTIKDKRLEREKAERFFEPNFNPATDPLPVATNSPPATEIKKETTEQVPALSAIERARARLAEMKKGK